jgi:glycosyltransferase involved in cell wall biosynthesis
MLLRCLTMMRGGGETRHLAWARELRALGVEVDIIAGRPLIGRARYRVDAGVPVDIIRSPYAREFVYRYQRRRGFGRLTMQALHADEELFCRLAWRRIAERTRPPDVVHAHALHQAARLRAGGVPVVINLPGEPHRRYVEDLRKADALVADGWAASHLPAILGCDVERVPKGVDADRFTPNGPSVRESLRLADKRVVVAVSRLVPLKNLALLLDAFNIVRERVPRSHLVIVGSGPEAAMLRDRACALEIAHSVTFAGSVPQAETPAFYRAGDVFALSSDFDNSPNVVLEAMASGLPVVTTDAGGVREFVVDRIGGAIVPRREPAALAAALQQYLSSPEAARAAGEHNRVRAATEFSWRASATRLLAVYHRVVSTRVAA